MLNIVDVMYYENPKSVTFRVDIVDGRSENQKKAVTSISHFFS